MAVFLRTAASEKAAQVLCSEAHIQRRQREFAAFAAALDAAFGLRTRE